MAGRSPSATRSAAGARGSCAPSSTRCGAGRRTRSARFTDSRPCASAWARARPRWSSGPGPRSHGVLAPRADQAAVLFALQAGAMEEAFPHGRVVAIAHDGDHVAAVVAEVLAAVLSRGRTR